MLDRDREHIKSKDNFLMCITCPEAITSWIMDDSFISTYGVALFGSDRLVKKSFENFQQKHYETGTTRF